MKRFLFCIPLLGLAPLGYSLGSYLSSLGTISWYAGYVIASLSFLLVPLLVPIVLASLYKKASWILRIMLFIILFYSRRRVFSFLFLPKRLLS